MGCSLGHSLLKQDALCSSFCAKGRVSVHLAKHFYVMKLLSFSKQNLGLLCVLLFLLGEFQAFFKQAKPENY